MNADNKIDALIARKQRRMQREVMELSAKQRLERFVRLQLGVVQLLQDSGNLELFHRRNRFKRRVSK